MIGKKIKLEELKNKIMHNSRLIGQHYIFQYDRFQMTLKSHFQDSGFRGVCFYLHSPICVIKLGNIPR